jgi:hypothetical protein
LKSLTSLVHFIAEKPPTGTDPLTGANVHEINAVVLQRAERSEVSLWDAKPAVADERQQKKDIVSTA